MDEIQCRMARVALGWTSRQLAAAADVPVATVNHIQLGKPVSPEDTARVRAAFEHSGVTFLDENEDGFGIRLRKERPT